MGRIQSVDVFRVLAIIAVVALHTAAYSGPHAVGLELDRQTLLNNAERFAVPLFFVLSGFFWAARCETAADFRERSIQMSKRIMLIFLAWTCIYLVAPVGQAFHDYGFTGPVKEFYWSLSASGARFFNAILEGPKVHLWFLPALVWSVLISGAFLARRMERTLLILAIVLFFTGLGGHAYRDTPLGFHSNLNLRDGPFFGLIFFVTGYFLQKSQTSSGWLPAGIMMASGGLALQIAEVSWLHREWGAA